MASSDAPSGASLARLTRSSIYFAAGAVAGKVIGLVMLPVLTRALTPEEYGNLDVLLVLANALALALLLGLDVAALRLYFDRADERGRRSLFGTWYAIGLVVSGSAGVVLIALSGTISAVLFSTEELQFAVIGVAVVVIAGTVQAVVLTDLRASGRAGWFAVISAGTLLMYAVLTVVLLRLWRPDPDAVIVAWATAVSLSAVFGTVLLRRQILGRPTTHNARALLRLGLPLAPATAGILVSDFLIRTILLGTAGSEQVAFFTVGNRFASVAALSLVVLQLAWVPRIYDRGVTEAARRQLAYGGIWILAIVCAAVLGIATFSPAIIAVAAGSTYLAALPSLGLGLVNVIGTALFLVFSLPSALAHKTEDIGIATGAMAIVAVVATAAFAPIWGGAGAAGAVALSQMTAVLIVAVLGVRRLHVPFDWIRLTWMSVATSVAVLVLVVELPIIERVVVVVAAVAAIAVAVPLREGIGIARQALGR